jgi:hypothetical protein
MKRAKRAPGLKKSTKADRQAALLAYQAKQNAKRDELRQRPGYWEGTFDTYREA